jgi:hypothetical protein
LELTHDRHNYAATASRILGDSLKPLPGMAKINLTLERFAHNLEKLLRMDKLSSPQNGGISCYQAIFGVYASLKKLFDHEKKMALTLMDAKDPRAGYKAEREVLCKKSGRPRLNAGDCLGLSLEYWLDRRHIFEDGQHPYSAKGKETMDVDSPPSDYPEDKDPSTHKIYSLTIECESSPSSMYSPIRISDTWISDAIEKAPDAPDTDMNNPINTLLNQSATRSLDWQEPPPTYLPSAPSEGDNAHANDVMNLDNAPGRLPNIRFVAKFNPPLVVPLSVVVTIYQAFGMEMPSDIRPTTFAGLALRPGETDPGMAMAMVALPGSSTHESPRTYELKSRKSVLVVGKDGTGETEKVHESSLYVPRGTEYARTIESLPFVHPRQLVEILPTLRQYAFTTSLMQRSFGMDGEDGGKKSGKNVEHPVSSPLTPKGEAVQQVDVSLSYAPPAPRLRFDIPRATLSTSAPSPTEISSTADLLASLLAGPAPKPPLSVTVDVLPNVELVVSGGNIGSASASTDDASAIKDVDMGTKQGEGQGDEGRVKRVARALDICMDIDVWAEWVRREIGE